ncbi:hypothetical protein [Polaromonas sp. SM01]|uniref:hypothetical protein n=1 Tax=Polaromonas sp. SM01 TaxID=3085630 RepID=UPI00298158BB|nr:hypothetical protein [Polaromonas sp. SM01]
MIEPRNHMGWLGALVLGAAHLPALTTPGPTGSAPISYLFNSYLRLPHAGWRSEMHMK